MSKLIVQTRDGSNPKNRPKVYVCCHPDDQAEMLSVITKEIWSVCDAALCYDAEPYSNLDEESFFSDLLDVRMTIIVVTHRFLTEDSRDKNTVMPFLASRNLPILPLVRETDLEQLFAQVMGDLQYLAIPSQNSTELPYEEKLRIFLRKAFPDGDSIEKIRGAFRSRIFLSYRKVDRKDARKLIRFVHEIDEYRDVAVWYDDFLTFGEDFNVEISEEIKASDLFAMAVTPNIVKDENYVIKKEYPLAVQEKKAILPIEMHSTNRAQLSESFQNIPNCVSYEETKNLKEALHKVLGQADACQMDPVHDYLIGLAYLNGIDVEVDAVRGFALIRAAADAGVVEACEKLVDMYWVGDGTPVDRDEALSRQEKLIELLQSKKEGSTDPEDSLAYARALYNKANLLCELRRYTEALPYATRARSTVDALCTLKSTPLDALLSKYAILCSEIHLNLHHDGRGGLFLIEAFAYMDTDTENIADFYRQLVTLMLTLRNANDVTFKTEHIDKCVKAAKMVYEDSGMEFDKEQYVRCLLWAANCHEEKKNKIEHAEHIISLLTSSEGMQLSESMENYLAQAYMCMGQNLEDDKQQKEYMEKALEISLKYPDSARHREAAVGARVFLAILLYKTDGRTEQSNQMYEQALAEIRSMAQKTQNINHYKLQFLLESMEDDAVNTNTLKKLKFQMDCWKSLCERHPRTREFKKEYATARRLFRVVKVLSFLGLFKEEEK